MAENIRNRATRSLDSVDALGQGFRATRATALRVTNEGTYRAVPTKGGRKVDARGIGAVSALSAKAAKGTSLARMMKRNPGVDRRMSVRFVDPATLRA